MKLSNCQIVERELFISTDLLTTPSNAVDLAYAGLYLRTQYSSYLQYSESKLSGPKWAEVACGAPQKNFRLILGTAGGWHTYVRSPHQYTAADTAPTPPAQL
jgi:hypothetical protein